jgi:hypothetical protein
MEIGVKGGDKECRVIRVYACTGVCENDNDDTDTDTDTDNDCKDRYG